MSEHRGKAITTEEFVARLQGVRRSGSGYLAQCPAHDDATPSLSIREGADGRVLVYCHGGCETPAICAAMGLSLADLMPPAASQGNGNGKLDVIATYDYLDEEGRLLYQVCRLAPKSFRQRRPDGDGAWSWNLGNVSRVLYHLPGVIETAKGGRKAILVVEGEKDVEALKRLGVVATCNSGGAGKWRAEFSEALVGAKLVVVLPDHDKPGRDHARQVAESLARAGVEHVIVELPGLAEKGDVSDWLAAGGTKEGLEQLVKEALLAPPAESEPTAPPEAGEPGSDESPDVLFLGHHRTDTGNAARLIDYCGQRVRYCDLDASWYVYDGLRWKQDDTRHIEDLAGEALRGIYEEAARENDDARRESLGKWAVASEARARRRDAVDLARSDRRVAIRPADLNADGWLLNCLNGTLDLHTGRLQGHDPADMISKLAPVPYDPEARSDLWERALREATGGDQDYLDHVHRFLGSCLTADTTAELFAVAKGETGTAKSTVFNPVRKVMGDYAADVQPETFCTRDRVGGTRDDLLRLAGVRLALVPEADKRRHLDEAMLKRFVSGEGWPERGVYQRDRELLSVAKVITHTNEMPRMSDDDDAIWRRALSWPFDHPPEVADESVKKTLLDLASSGPAILAWLVEGCLAWQRDGGGRACLGTSTTVEQAKAALRQSMNPFTDFFAECLVFEEAWTDGAELRAALAKWCKDYRQELPSAKALATALSKKRCVAEKVRHQRGWRGVRLVGASGVEAPF